jgi:hypothetical protein
MKQTKPAQQNELTMESAQKIAAAVNEITLHLKEGNAANQEAPPRPSLARRAAEDLKSLPSLKKREA